MINHFLSFAWMPFERNVLYSSSKVDIGLVQSLSWSAVIWVDTSLILSNHV